MKTEPTPPSVWTPHIGHIVVIAAVSGAGKSTFVKELKSGSVPREIRDKLPVDAGDWPCLAFPGQVQRYPMARNPLPGLLLEYDMNGPVVSAGGSYDDDPTLDILHLAKIITIVNLRPPVERIVNQLVQREKQAQDQQEAAQQSLI